MIGGHATSLKQFDGLIFTGGIGENSTLIRELVTQRLRIFGMYLDGDKNNHANNAGERIISSANTAVAIAVIPTNEEKMIALDALHVGKKSRLAEYA